MGIRAEQHRPGGAAALEPSSQELTLSPPLPAVLCVEPGGPLLTVGRSLRACSLRQGPPVSGSRSCDRTGSAQSGQQGALRPCVSLPGSESRLSSGEQGRGTWGGGWLSVVPPMLVLDT